MKQTVYHEINPASLDKILQEGIERTSEGIKSKDKAIQKVNRFLDSHRPPGAVKAKLSRQDNLYGYLTDGDQLVDITDGKNTDIAFFKAKDNQRLVKIAVDPTKCYVADLDLYDTIKRALELDEQDSTRENLATQYWAKLIRLSDYNRKTIRRPEVMITYDVPPNDIQTAD